MKEAKIVGIPSMPRWMPWQTARCIARTAEWLAHRGYATHHVGNFSWEQTIQNSVEDALQIYDNEYFLFFDGDGVWTEKDVLTLLDIMDNGKLGDRPIDAVFPVQAQRNADWPLIHNWMAHTGVRYDHDADVMEHIHGHFGLTFIRAECFRKMPMPWLWAQPNRHNGSWREGKIDPDTYFWTKFRQHGFRVAQANKVIVGHMDEHVRWQCGPKIKTQTLYEYDRDGKPLDVRYPYPEEIIK